MTREILVLGSTGSIGTQTLDVARNLGIKINALSSNSNISLLEEQIREFKPLAVAVADKEKAAALKKAVADTDVRIYGGNDGLAEMASVIRGDTAVSSIVGIAGLVPTMEAINSGKNIALANKETLVTAGHIVMDAASRKNISIIPVDSEHSAIFQSLMGNNDKKEISKLILTASGGPFRGKKREELGSVTREQALKHPNWSMGSKITIDSATLMNKGLEVIEAKWLFDIGSDRIQVVVHPQSIIHSMVEYVDGSIIAQLGSPDMRIPIQFALTYPERKDNSFSRLDLFKQKEMTFEKPDKETFRCLELAFKALSAGGSMPVVLNAANEIAVDLFLKDKIGFLQISELIEKVMNKHDVIENPVLDRIIAADAWARKEATMEGEK